MQTSLRALSLLALCAGCQNTQVHNSFHQPPVEGTALTQLDRLPVSGAAHYAGHIGLGFDDPARIEDARLVGQMNLAADFRRDELRGEARDFVDRLTGESLDGRLDVDAAFDRSTDLRRYYGVIGSAQGRLQDDAQRVVDVDVGLNGDFFGRTGSTLEGDVTGTVEGLPLTPETDVTGVFEVTR